MPALWFFNFALINNEYYVKDVLSQPFLEIHDIYVTKMTLNVY